ncbi:hypothetical protein AJ78_03337 [Emergomyces pasteurianus Ep9510]|uniref:C2H2-type domain-containing protein n=1 Tax=Emergomyces pasteurianus Ep9510 TaxID=1447872 RepID=A0A1J9PKT5_9EURO|nr:hypothetical protein AJ78_03337 [Emergomyces pasteurianus Ep9510]
MSSQRRQQSRSSSSQRSRISQSDQRATITPAQFEAINISSHTPPPSITVRHAPEYVTSDLRDFDTNLAVSVSQAQQDWSSLQMTATVDPNSTPLLFGTGSPNPEITYSDFPLGREQYSTEHMNIDLNDTMHPPSSTVAQSSYFYAVPTQAQLPDYRTENQSSMPQEFQVNFVNRNLLPQGPISPDTSSNMPPTRRHHYSLQPPQVSSTRDHKDRVSITLSELGPQGRVPHPSNKPDEYLQHGFMSHRDAGPYPNPPTMISSLTPDYLNHPAPNASRHIYPTSSSQLDPLHPYQSSRQYSFSPITDVGVPPTTLAPAGEFSTPYSVSPTPEDQVRVVNSRPKPQCWDHGCNGREFSTFSNLLRHQREKAGTATKSECPHCGTVFTRTTARNGHLAQGKCKAKREQE